jgi:hypothetical protein
MKERFFYTGASIVYIIYKNMDDHFTNYAPISLLSLITLLSILANKSLLHLDSRIFYQLYFTIPSWYPPIAKSLFLNSLFNRNNFSWTINKRIFIIQHLI